VPRRVGALSATGNDRGEDQGDSRPLTEAPLGEDISVIAAPFGAAVAN
jgi:hypothetical protein